MKTPDLIKLTFFILLFFTLTVIPACHDDDDDVVTVTDYDGNTYEAVTIGSQTWLRTNLKVTHYRNGDGISKRDRAHWDPNSTEGAYADYEDDTTNVALYGHLYNWYAVADSRGLAPAGYHVASDEDWRELGDFLGGDTIAGGKLKETGTAHWMTPNEGATDEVDFTGLPGGERVVSLTYDDGKGTLASFWTSTSSVQYPQLASFRGLGFDIAEIYGRDDAAAKSGGFSVRCVKD